MNSGLRVLHHMGLLRLRDLGLAILPAMTLLLVGCDQSAPAITLPEPDRVRLAPDQNFYDFGSHVVHVNALTTNQLTPSIATAYDIVRSDSRAMLNVVILEKNDTTQGKPAIGVVSMNAVNLTGQLKSLDIRQIEDGENIYYIGDVSIDNYETLNFNIDVVPDGYSTPMLLTYTQTFYTD